MNSFIYMTTLFFKKNFLFLYKDNGVKSFLLLFFFLPLSLFAQKEYKTFYHTNGKISSEGYWVNNQPDGLWKTYSEKGILISIGNRKLGQLDSTWKFFDEKGRLERTIDFKEGKKNGWQQEFDSTGTLLEMVPYIQNLKEGVKKTFYSNGKVHWLIPFSANKEEGKAKEYADDGRWIGVTKYSLGFVAGVERFNKLDKNGLREGLWKEFYPESESILKDGIWSAGKKNGLFQYYDRKGIVNRTETYENDILVTDNGEAGNLKFKEEELPDGTILRGGYAGNEKQGVFHVERKSGERIINQVYQQGIKVAEGLLDDEGMRQGIWKEYYLTGELKAEGEYHENLRVGDWKYYNGYGNIEQTGKYWKGLPHDEWVWYYPNKKMHRREHYDKGNLEGSYVEWDSSGVVILEGNYENDNKVGQWKYQLNDHLEIGEYQDGEKNGVWKWYYNNENEPAFEGEFIGGVPRGKHKMWYQNGKLMEKGEYEGGLKSGDWLYYNELGELRITLTYEAGVVTFIDGVRALPKGM
jgi:antitoxin component YwqK of YwqJK toxin-antitoxin module